MKKLLTAILAVVGIGGCRPSQIEPIETQFVFVKIPEAIGPIERGEKYEDPLDSVLQNEAVGEVAGGGSQLSNPDADGRRVIEWVGIDVDLSNFDKGMPVLKRELLRLGAPPGTILEYS